MIGLTPAQSDLLRFLVARGPKKCPSYDEMAVYMGTVKSAVHRLILALEERGYIRRLPGRARAIEVLPQTENMLRRVTTAELVKELQYRGYAVTKLPAGDAGNWPRMPTPERPSGQVAAVSGETAP